MPPSGHHPHYGKTLKHFRDRLGLSEEATAAAIGIARMTYRSFEASKERPTSWRFDEAKVLSVLKVSKNEFDQVWLNGAVEIVNRLPSALAEQVKQTVKRLRIPLDEAAVDAWKLFLASRSH